MTKLREQNLNPHRPVSKSRGAVFSIYQEPFSPKQSMNSTQSKIDLNSVAKVAIWYDEPNAKCCHLLVEHISCRVSSSYKQQSKLILIIRNCNGFLNTLATRLLSPIVNQLIRRLAFLFFLEGSLASVVVVVVVFGFLYFLYKATFLLTSTEDCAKN